ncbi:phasin family protein [Anaeromyxobacter oryzisoli]|uniref:phasin family protein n=1 Tax=Anaeromyxobacter oryzisoli TaxID=2925408 RepID=UPI001F59EBB7|nr:phasin family protein [Anaeromyxobacter sp. SG63]
MRLDDVLRNPMLKRALAVGEEGMGRVVGKLLSSDRVTTGLSSLVSSAVQARGTFERGVQQALHAANLPSRDDVAALRRKLEELESMIDGLSERIEAAPPGGPRPGEGRGPDEAA